MRVNNVKSHSKAQIDQTSQTMVSAIIPDWDFASLKVSDLFVLSTILLMRFFALKMNVEST